MPVPSPKSAVTIGSPIARNEPKLISSTITAARMPIPVVVLGGANSVCSIAWPAELDLERVRLDALGLRDHGLDRANREGVRFLVEGDRGEADRAVLEMRVPAFGSNGLVTPVT